MRRRVRRTTEVSRDMKKLILVSAGLLLAASVNAEDINETLDAAADGTVEIYNTSGSVTVEGWSRNAVEVTGTLGEEVDEFIFERKGDTVVVKVKPIQGKSSGGRSTSSYITVQAPQKSSIDVATISAGIDVEGIEGEQELQSVSGGISTTAFGADVEAETVSGGIDIVGSNMDSETELATVSGGISARDMAGTIDLESVNGKLEVGGGSFSDAALETVNGRIEFKSNLRDGGDLDIETVNGKVVVDFIGSLSAEVDVNTFNGRIKNCFGPKPERTSKYAPGWELSFTEGGGDGSVSIATLNGGVTLCKE
jgi:DUF4097 and DUF4098 domain-containing protein YvlB